MLVYFSVDGGHTRNASVLTNRKWYNCGDGFLGTKRSSPSGMNRRAGYTRGGPQIARRILKVNKIL